jgi:hypothetical protein
MKLWPLQPLPVRISQKDRDSYAPHEVALLLMVSYTYDSIVSVGCSRERIQGNLLQTIPNQPNMNKDRGVDVFQP